MFSLMSAYGFVGVIISDDGIKESSESFSFRDSSKEAGG